MEIVVDFLHLRPFCSKIFFQVYLFPGVYLQFAIDPAAGI